jgi:hypothetical protein
VAAPRGDHEERLAQRIPALRRAIEEQLADVFGTGGAARLARAECGDAGLRQRLKQALLLRRFPGPFPAFQRDEFAATQFLRPKMR